MKTPTGTDVKRCVDLLQKGQVVALPTETVYGLAANGLDESAVKKIFEAKQRPLSNPLILHFLHAEAILPYVTDFPKELQHLAQQFWPGPLTLLLPKSILVPEVITAGNVKVAVRVPSHPLFREVLSQLDFPLAAPSANLYGTISPTEAAHVSEQMQQRIPYVLDGGSCNHGLESTIIGLEKDAIIVYRLGSIPIEAIVDATKLPVFVKNHSGAQPLTSGMVKYHYSPDTPFYFFDIHVTPEKNAGFIFFNKTRAAFPIENQFILSETSNMEEAAQKLYAAMHAMDQKGFSQLFIERFPEAGLGKTINDRLNRATAKYEK